ncbi:MAG TPA: enoyl-CoA hydratase-related protein [Steroidobacteraceae bacterium]|nr:enoyl-CoA hydratase-related protein [Steroidobacteraceae bacterium]
MALIIRRTLEEGILEVRLNRPDRLNALTAPLVGEVVEAFESLRDDRSTRVVILTGEGKGFCAGADQREPAEPGDVPGTAGMGTLGFVYKFQEYLARMIQAVYECEKPVIAAVNGAAVGGGLALALAADIRVASTAARFGDVVIKTGLTGCDVGISYLLSRIVGAGVAAELMLTGRVFDAAEARELRLVSRVTEPEALGDAALEVARSIAEHSEYGTWMTKKGLQLALDAPSLRHSMEIENRTQVLGTFTGCYEEGSQAFQERRKPRWRPL